MMVYVVFGVTIAAGSISEFFFFSSRRRHTRYIGDWSSDVCSSDLRELVLVGAVVERVRFPPHAAEHLMGMHPGARRAEDRLGHEGRQQAPSLRHCLDGVLEGHEMVGAFRSEERRVGKERMDGWRAW